MPKEFSFLQAAVLNILKLHNELIVFFFLINFGCFFFRCFCCFFQWTKMSSEDGHSSAWPIVKRSIPFQQLGGPIFLSKSQLLCQQQSSDIAKSKPWLATALRTEVKKVETNNNCCEFAEIGSKTTNCLLDQII